jgi:hypothetical protein
VDQRSGTTGFYFFAANGKTIHGGNSYYVMLSGRSVYLYKCVNDNQQYYASYTIPSKEEAVRFHLEFHSGEGSIILSVNGEEAMRWKDPKPHEEGRFIILHANGSAAFDNVIVNRIGDSILPTLTAGSGDEDVVLFVNGDVISGTVDRVSQENVVVTTEYDPEGLVIAKSRVSSVRFKGEREADLTKADLHYRVIMWNGDVVSCAIHSLDGEEIKVESSSAGNLRFPRAIIKCIEAPPDLNIY